MPNIATVNLRFLFIKSHVVTCGFSNELFPQFPRKKPQRSTLNRGQTYLDENLSAKKTPPCLRSGDSQRKKKKQKIFELNSEFFTYTRVF